MKNVVPFLVLSLVLVFQLGKAVAQDDRQLKSLMEMGELPLGVHHYWIEMGSDNFGKPILVPAIVIQGNKKGPTLGLTAGIHGNELNGIAIIHQLTEKIDPNKLAGRIIGIPGINPVALSMDQRKFNDDEDVNRLFPGKENGDGSQQFAFKIKERILPAFDYMIDLHTASFGRINSMYVRADLNDETLKNLAILQKADIILNNAGVPSFGSSDADNRTFRAEAILEDIPTITVELGNPQVYQNDMIDRGLEGVLNTLGYLKMFGENPIKSIEDKAVYCKKSYWIYTEEGGFLDVIVDLNEKVKKGQKIAVLRNAFGTIIHEYIAPENGIIIGKSANPSNISGGRIVHLGLYMDN